MKTNKSMEITVAPENGHLNNSIIQKNLVSNRGQSTHDLALYKLDLESKKRILLKKQQELKQ